MVGHDADRLVAGAVRIGALALAVLWEVSARAGWIRAHNNVKVSYDTPVVDGAVSRSTTRTGEYFGAGVGYNINEHVSVGLAYDNYHVRFGDKGRGDNWNVGMYSLTGEYRF